MFKLKVLLTLLIYLPGCASIFPERMRPLDELKDLDEVNRIEIIVGQVEQRKIKDWASDHDLQFFTETLDSSQMGEIDPNHSIGVWTLAYTETIDSPQRINVITDTFEGFSENWDSGYANTFPGNLMVDFYKDEELILPLFIASYPNTEGGTSYFLSRPAGPVRRLTEAEFKALMKLLELDENLAYYGRFQISTNP